MLESRAGRARWWIDGGRGLFAMAMVVALTGCETMPGMGTAGTSLSAEERALREDAKLFDATVLGGAAAGAAAGGLGCMLFGGSLSDCATEIAVGAAVGGVAGYMTASSQRAANEQVRQTDIVTRDIVAENVKLAKLVSSARSVLESNRADAEALKARIAGKEADAAEIEAMQARLRSNIGVMSTTIDTLTEKKRQFAEVAANLQSQGEETAKVREQVREMEDHSAFSASHGVKSLASSAQTFRMSTGESVPIPSIRQSPSAASSTSPAFTVNPGRVRELARSPRPYTPCLKYPVSPSARTVMVPASGSTIQYSGIAASA